MSNTEKSKKLDKSNASLENYFENMDLNEDLKSIYEMIGNNQEKAKYNHSIYINKLRNENHKRYYDIDINKLNGLPDKFINEISDIIKPYNLIDSKNLLNEDELEVQNHKQLIDEIYTKINCFRENIKIELKKLVLENDSKEIKFNIDYFNLLELNDDKKKRVLEVYNELILNNAKPTKNVYSDLKKEINRTNYINDILSIIDENYNNLSNLSEDIIESSPLSTLEDPVDTNIINETIDKSIDYEEENLINYDSNKISQIQTSVNFVIQNYHNDLDDETNNLLTKILNNVNNNINIDECIEKLNSIIKNICNQTITDVYSYNSNKNFYFICSNNQFIDEKYQTILITNKELEKVQNYFDFQIGFICNYNGNILYITDKEDVMEANKNEILKFKTPLQLEEEFDNFKTCSRIALDGYNTEITAVYFIDDGSQEKYIKAVGLANQNSLPLIILKKDK